MKRSAPMRRTPFRRRAPGAEPASVSREIDDAVRSLAEIAARKPTRPPARMARLLSSEPARPVPKPETFRSEAWLAAVRSIPCVHCGGPAEAAHRNEGKGGAIKVDDCLAAALCRPEHTRVDRGKDLSREERRALIDRYIVATLVELVRRGLVGVVR